MSNDDKKRDEGYVAAYDAAQRLHARQIIETAAAEKEEEALAAHGKALLQIKRLARAAFMTVPGATEEAFEQLWRAAFHVE